MNDPLYDPEVLRKLCARMTKIDFRVHPKPPSRAEAERLNAAINALQNDSRPLGLMFGSTVGYNGGIFGGYGVADYPPLLGSLGISPQFPPKKP